MNIKLTEGNVSETLLKFSLPILASEMIQRVCILTDNIIAGKFIGEYALAAIGSVFPITVVFTSIALGLSNGCSVIISQLCGKKDYSSMKTAVSTTVLSSLFVSVALALFGLIFSNSFVMLVNVPTEVFDSALIYLQLYMISFVFKYLYSICTGIFIAIGDSKLAFFCLMTSSILNIVFNIVFVCYLNLGIPGIALAALIVQIIMAFITIAVLIKKMKGFQEEEQYKRFSSATLKSIGKLCIPSILKRGIVSLGDVYMLRIINSYGVMATTGYTAALQLNMFFFTCLLALGNGLSSYTAQNIGAERIERVKKGLKSGIVMSVCIALLFFTLFTGFPKKFLYFFLNEESIDTVSIGVTFLRLTTPFYVVVCIKQLIDGVLRGSGAMLYPLGITIVDLLQRVILVNILPSYYGLRGVFITFPTGWTLSAVLYCIFFYKGVWKQRNVLSAESTKI